ncbi:MAG: phosphate acetyltransferase [candidate division Zixibacteria bacterium]|nr:phosphate acetyltransferase [candidate division Zixibacteria bacterium]
MTELTNISAPMKAIYKKAKSRKRRIVFPEGSEPRTIKAIGAILENQIAEVTVLGDKNEINKLACNLSVDLSQALLLDPTASNLFDKFVADFVKIRQKKNISKEKAIQTLSNPLYFGAMLVRNSEADTMVAGAANTTADVIRSAIRVLGLKKAVKTISSSFLMIIPEYMGQKDKVFLFADCGVLPDPDPEELASIAVSTAETMELLFGIEPNIALLSFSTKGSARHADVKKVTETLKILNRDFPNLKVDGELQLDAAIVPAVQKQKAPDSIVAGEANILIFPSLDAGNIGYKLTQRLAQAKAIGPILQGLTKPVNDLSRGCSVEDIIDAAAIACVMAE